MWFDTAGDGVGRSRSGIWRGQSERVVSAFQGRACCEATWALAFLGKAETSDPSSLIHNCNETANSHLRLEAVRSRGPVKPLLALYNYLPS